MRNRSTGNWLMIGAILLASCIPMANASAQVQQQETTVISIPEQADVTLTFTAGELSKYFEAMTGQNHPVVSEGKSAGAPLVRLQVDTRLHHDGYRIYRNGPSICISGGSPRGCLYGTYTLLVDLGCRFPVPGKQFEIVPQLKKISWPGPTIQSEPAITGRGMILISHNVLEEIIELLDWMAKNRFNFIYLCGQKLPSEMLPALKEAFTARDMGLEWGSHWLPKYLPRDLFKEHPEYFRVEDGKRTHKLNMCPSSAGAADVIAKNSMADWEELRDFPRFETLHIWPDDLGSGGWCSCEKCKDLTDSDQALKIINEVARRLPLGETTISHCAYHATVSPPNKVKPHANVRLLWAPRERCYKHALDECQVNREYLEHLKGQVQMFPNEPEIFEYYHDMILFRDLPLPLHPIIGKDTKVYRDAGVVRIASLSFEKFSKWAYEPNYYVLGKCLWRGQGDPRDMEEYCETVYGPRAKAMKEYFDLLFEFCGAVMELCGYDVKADMRYPPKNRPYTKTHIAKLAAVVTPAHLDRIEVVLNDALDGAPEPYRTRIENQLRIWKFARIDVPTVYRTLLAGYLNSNLGPDATETDRLYVIAIIKKLLQDIDKSKEYLLTVPLDLRGPFYWENTPPEKRFRWMKNNPRIWLERLEKQQQQSTPKTNEPQEKKP